MKQTHDEIIANWLPRQAKLKAAFTNKAQPIEYRAKAFRLYFTLTMQIAIVAGHKKDEWLKSLPQGGISYGGPTGDPEHITPLSNLKGTKGGEYIVNAKKTIY